MTNDRSSRSKYPIPPPPLPLPADCLAFCRPGLSSWEAAEGGLRHAIDLVRLIREEHGDYFGVAVAGHPEGHVEGRAAAAAAAAEGDSGAEGQDTECLELQHLKDKVGRLLRDAAKRVGKLAKRAWARYLKFLGGKSVQQHKKGTRSSPD